MNYLFNFNSSFRDFQNKFHFDNFQTTLFAEHVPGGGCDVRQYKFMVFLCIIARTTVHGSLEEASESGKELKAKMDKRKSGQNGSILLRENEID